MGACRSSVGGGGMKVCSWDLGHMIKMAACPYMVKTFENLLRNQMAEDLETWYAPFVLRLYQVYSNGDSWFTLTYFTARSNLVT